MKKTLFFVAAAALALTACTNETDIVQTPKQVEQQGVAFDVYTPTSTNQTRTGRTNVMTTGIMQQTGFGIFAYQNEREDKSTLPGHSYNSYDYSVGPNFMWNQQVNWTTTGNGWYYSPLKYWPNETIKDSQSTPSYMPDVDTPTSGNNDFLSFFAYAPWVQSNAGGVVSAVNSNLEGSDSYGIKGILSNTNTTTDPVILYGMAKDPDYSVDLLWGVAPVGGLSYTNVFGTTTTIEEGMPLIGLIKPAVNTNIKFMFQHSLARIGVKVVAAADQVAAGGSFDYANTKITIAEIRIMGPFGTEGTLNLNNAYTTAGANIPNWTIATTGNTDGTALKIAANAGLAPHLAWNGSTTAQQTVTGVTTTLADAIKVRALYDADYSTDCATAETNPAYSATRPYFANAADIATPTYATYNDFSIYGPTFLQAYTSNGGTSYTDITSTINTQYPTATVWENIYTTSYLHKVTDAEFTAGTYSTFKAYRKVGNVYQPTGTAPQENDYVFALNAYTETAPVSLPAPSYTGTYYKAKPNYFMVIPPTYVTPQPAADRTLRVKITYYVSTTDANLAGGIVYTKNEVEREVELPDFKNGKAYDLKLILGLTSVKVEAEVNDWVTTNAEVNLPQNISE